MARVFNEGVGTLRSMLGFSAAVDMDGPGHGTGVIDIDGCKASYGPDNPIKSLSVMWFNQKNA